MISSYRIAPMAILRIFMGTIQQVRHLGKGKEYIYLSFLSMNLSFLISHKALITLQRATKITHPRKSLSLYLKYLHKNILVPLLCQCGFFIRICVPKNSIVSKDVIFYRL